MDNVTVYAMDNVMVYVMCNVIVYAMCNAIVYVKACVRKQPNSRYIDSQ